MIFSEFEPSDVDGFKTLNIADAVTFLELPDASVGSVYSTKRTSPCNIQCLEDTLESSNLI